MINDIAVRLDLLKKRKRGAKFKYEEIKFYNDFFYFNVRIIFL